MERLPDEIIQRITIQGIIFLKNSLGWLRVHKYIKKYHLVLKLTSYQYPYEYHFSHIYRSTITVKSTDILRLSRLNLL